MLTPKNLSLQLCVVLGLGCAAPPAPVDLRATVGQRTGHVLPAHAEARPFEVPEGVVLADGVTEEEAVALGLWNSPGLHADLTALGVARADLLQAGLLRNPVLSTLLPSGPKQAEGSLSWLLDSLWERPRRVAAARFHRDRVAESLVGRSLDAAREIRLAFIGALAARSATQLADRELALRVESDAISQVRARAGQIGELEAMLARSDALLARQQAARSQREAERALRALRNAIGAGADAPPLDVVPEGFSAPPPVEPSELLRMARAARPELRAASLAMEEAAQQAGWERRRLLKLTAVLDANDTEGGTEVGPGFVLELPLFDRNQAGIQRAEAQIQDAAWRYLAVKRRIENEVAEADATYRFALAERDRFRQQTQPVFEEARAVAMEYARRGALDHLEVLNVQRQQLLSQQQGVQLEAAVRLALAELERSLGRVLDVRS